MREIIFRGKRIDNGEWVEGSLVKINDEEYGECIAIIPTNTYSYRFNIDDGYYVYTKTIGQFTGLYDKNGKKIFEGNIVQTRRYEMYTEELKGYHGYDEEGYPQKLPGYTGSMTVHKTRANDNYHAVVRFSPTKGFYLDGASVYINAIRNTVVGNIYDNPELVEEK